ncbi:MAG: outer membrane lipoprotein-sorting protein [Proteobacteria bacterium]|nr:outer membrane lipoprotein-sorting protein [Pseudomonadota bacterium]MBU4037228.1 outer membrane lipoprotein-sorting protein [Pseudomonadota bacterium]
MKKICFLWIIMFLILSAMPSNAETPDVSAIIEKIKIKSDALPISKKVTIIVKKGERITGQMVARTARKKFTDGRRFLLVLLEPNSLKGLSYLLRDLDDRKYEQWIYLPYIDRVRKISEASTYESFLSTDFTYADLFLITTKNESFKYLGEEEIGGMKAYKIESVSKEPNYFYSRIINWVAKDSFLIIRRDYYSPNQSLWKRQLFENMIVINGAVVPLRIRMLDFQHDTSTELIFTEIDSDIELPDEIFVPEQLKYSLDCPVWQKVCYPTANKNKQ